MEVGSGNNSGDRFVTATDSEGNHHVYRGRLSGYNEWAAKIERDITLRVAREYCTTYAYADWKGEKRHEIRNRNRRRVARMGERVPGAEQSSHPSRGG